jgi:hypothetical protein
MRRLLHNFHRNFRMSDIVALIAFGALTFSVLAQLHSG